MYLRIGVPLLSIGLFACSSSTYTVGGMVTGLQGSGLVLQTDGTNSITISKNGSFTLPGALTSKTPYFVTVLTQPSSPTQTCTVASAQGTIVGANVTSVAVTCTTGTYPVGGTVTGLTGTGLVLEDNGGDDLTVSASGSFTFATPIATGAAYAVTVKAQPTTPSQTCAVTGGTGTIGSVPVTSVAVACTTSTFTVGGSITGLLGTGLVLQDNGGDDFTVTSGESFIFATPVASGALYSVTILTQPTNPAQDCTVSGGAGTVGSGNVTSVAVNCTTSTYTIGGTVLGLASTGLVLQDNGADNLQVSANGAFSFATPVASAGMFDVTVLTQPSAPAQTCVVTGAAGQMVGSAVSTVTVNCATNEYTVSGTASGLAGSGLALSLNGGTGIQVGMNGGFSFPQTLVDGTAYSVVIAGQPTSPSQTCTLTEARGTIAAANVSNVSVSCGTNTYQINVNVAGVVGTGLVLQDNGGDNLSIPSSGSYAFATPVASGAPYAVTVFAPPTSPTQTCDVSNGSGTVAGAAVGDVTVSCTTNTYSVGGTITGLAGTVVLQDNASDTLLVTPVTNSSAPISFTFAGPISSGATYAVTVSQQPGSPSQTCVVSNGTGMMGTAAITGVSIACTTNAYSLSATVVGLVGSGLIIADDLGDSVPVTQDSVIGFPTPYASGASYTISVSDQPTGPTQTCAVLGGTGTVGASNVTAITVNCSTNLYSIGGTVAGLLGMGLVLSDNVGDSVSISGNGTFSMPTSYASGAPYSLTVKTAPTGPSQTCTASNGSGTVGQANITNVAFTCVTSTYSVSVDVNGLVGSGLQLADNTADALTITQAGVSTFALPVASQKPYAVTVLNQPAFPSQTCTVASPTSGTISGSNVTVTVNCTTNSYAVSVAVTGLAGSGLKLWNNGGNALSVTSSGTFPFTTLIPSGGTYDVTVLTQPSSPAQVCTVTSPTGTMATAAVTVAVACTTSTFTVGGTVVGLAGGSVTLENGSASNTVTVSANGAFSFPTSVVSGSTYAVTVLTSPASPAEGCTVSGGSGTVATANVTNIVVACTTATFTVSGTVSNLSGTGLVLQLNGANNQTLTAGATSFSYTALASGAPYAVSVLTQPTSPTQTCTITNGSGTIASSSVTNLAIACTTFTCAAGTINNCVLVTTNSGGTDTGTCTSGYTGSCSFSCANNTSETWTQVTDTCSNAIIIASTGAEVTWTAPAAGTYTIQAVGGHGGTALGGGGGGLGAVATGTFSLTAGQVLTVLVGSNGSASSSAGAYGAAGGGGSFVVASGNVPLVVAGGGGGGGNMGTGVNASLTTAGSAGASSSGTNGAGGSSNGGGGGGGFSGNGAACSEGGGVAMSFENGGAPASCDGETAGGFGGGSGGYYAGGGGGGYSGGGGGLSSGIIGVGGAGGGSFVATSGLNTSIVQATAGAGPAVIITPP